jgi:hypothetical protein
MRLIGFVKEMFKDCGEQLEVAEAWRATPDSQRLWLVPQLPLQRLLRDSLNTLWDQSSTEYTSSNAALSKVLKPSIMAF